MEEQRISDEDGKLAVEIFKQALEHRPYIKKAILGDDLSALSEEERIKERLTQRVAVSYFGDNGNIPCLYLRFVGSMIPVAEVFFYPFEAISVFLDHLREYASQVIPDHTDEEKEKFANARAVEMTIIMIDSIFQRVDLMTDSFVTEVIIAWHIYNRNNLQHIHAQNGNPVPRQKDKSLDEAAGNYAKEVSKFWQSQNKGYGNWRKVRLAEEYEAIYSHWKWLNKMSRDNENWRQYAKAGTFDDTPDDLLYKLENTDRFDKKAVENTVSELAIEHAGRRVGLIKKSGVSPAVLSQRKNGIRATGYTATQLFIFLKEGRDISAQAKALEQSLNQGKEYESSDENRDST
jgi:hypothetical protein